jgi:dienelactone hydrolase
VRNIASAAVLVLTILAAGVAGARGAPLQSSGSVVELETPLASAHPLTGYLRRPNRAGPLPAVVLLHSCSGNWRQVDERWGKRIASWGYVTLAVDSFGPRGITNTCRDTPSNDFASDAFRALKFLTHDPSVDPSRVAAVGFSMGGLFALLSVERSRFAQTSPNKFRAVVAFYPPCGGLKGNVTVPTLILIGERDDLNWADDCRRMAEGRDGMGVSRQKDQANLIKLIVYPDAHHAFDVPGPENPRKLLGHHLEFNQSATDQSIAAVREFLDATIGNKDNNK